MLSKKLLTVLSLILIAGFVLPACQPDPEVIEVTVPPEVIEVTVPPEEIEVEVPVEVTVPVEIPVEVHPDLADRRGAIVDTVVVVEEPSFDQGVVRIDVGELDLYAHGISDPDIYAAIEAADNVDGILNFGSYNELTFNPSGPIFEGTGNLNPFAVRRVREAMNYLIDREYIVEEIHGGLGTPRWHAFNNASADYARMADVAKGLEGTYAYNPDLAEEMISEEMEALGAEMVNGVWQYEGEPVEVILLIRTEDARLDIGDYVGDQLEDIGFTITRDYRTAAEASPIWISGDPAEGQYHIYTGGWITTVVPRNQAGNFSYFYTDMGLPFPLWMAYEPTSEFYELADRLDRSDFRDLDERYEMMAQAMEWAMQDSVRVWINDDAGITPKRPEVAVAADLYGGVSGAWLWAPTLMREREIGGSMNIAMPSILTEEWNPLGGTNWIYDMMLIRGTAEMGHIPDPYTGLWWPRRFERAEVVVEEGLPVFQTLDWVDLEFADEIVVPDDAWADWDPVEQRFLTAGEVYTVPETVARMSRVYYPDDLFDTVSWHDGSPLSIGDFVMAMIMSFDRAQEESAVFDEAAVPPFQSFMANFRGVRIVSEDPLIIETYTNYYELDAEQSVTTWFPWFSFGPGSWHMLTLGLMADANLEAAFTGAKADAQEIERISYIAGPTIEILNNQLQEVLETGEIPYAPTLGEYIDDAEIEARFANYAEWYRRRGHFWLGTGPFYLERAFPVEGTVVLQRFLDYPDMADRWLIFAEPIIPEVELDGPGQVTIGEEATFEVWVEFEGAPYPAIDIESVNFLLFDATGAVAHTGEAQAVEDGLWEIVLDADVTGALEAGSNRLEAVVVSRLVAVTQFDAMTFVTAP